MENLKQEINNYIDFNADHMLTQDNLKNALKAASNDYGTYLSQENFIIPKPKWKFFNTMQKKILHADGLQFQKVIENTLKGEKILSSLNDSLLLLTLAILKSEKSNHLRGYLFTHIHKCLEEKNPAFANDQFSAEKLIEKLEFQCKSIIKDSVTYYYKDSVYSLKELDQEQINRYNTMPKYDPRNNLNSMKEVTEKLKQDKISGKENDEDLSLTELLNTQFKMVEIEIKIDKAIDQTQQLVNDALKMTQEYLENKPFAKKDYQELLNNFSIDQIAANTAFNSPSSTIEVMESIKTSYSI